MGFGAPTNRKLTEASGGGTSGQTSIVCTLPSTPAAGSVIFITLCYFDGVRTSCNPTAQDGLGNVYSMTEEDGRPLSSGILCVGRPLSLSAVKSAVITVGFDALSAPGLISVEIEEFPVTAGTASFFQTITTSSGSGTTITSPTITTTAGDLVLEAALSDHQVSTCDSPFTPVVEGVSGGSGTGIFDQFASGIGYLLSAGGGNLSVAFTQNVSSGNVAAVMAFHFTSNVPDKTPYQPAYAMAPIMAQ